MEVAHRATTPYHPQANGLTERLNPSLAYVTFAYNFSRQESTGRTPFSLLYGREARLPLDMATGVSSDTDLVDEPEAVARM